MNESYQPPFTMTEKITNLIVEIGEYVGTITTYDSMRPNSILRSGNVGVYARTELIHAETPAKYVPDLMAQLFRWLKQSNYHPLVKSCIFHYEFEFIHPFADGNGQMGRLWQSLILQKWKKFLHGFQLKRLYMKIRMNIIRYYSKLTVLEIPLSLVSLCLK